MPLPIDRMPADARTAAARTIGLARDLKELRAARRSAVPNPWQPLALASGWMPAGSTWAAPQVRQQPDGTVQLLGSIVPGTLTAGTVLAALPAGFAPQDDLEWRVGGGAATSSADLYVIAATGAVTIQNISGTITRISLSALIFPAA
ncbi:hypothetical protein ACFO3J_24090 [Streptomyces polygonati]|uniref:Uncharacterized protein n=1 Tax=Streptomyces polygonati TaxID=1617087 RepID=A0ABV8HU83_9ACTN